MVLRLRVGHGQKHDPGDEILVMKDLKNEGLLQKYYYYNIRTYCCRIADFLEFSAVRQLSFFITPRPCYPDATVEHCWGRELAELLIENYPRYLKSQYYPLKNAPATYRAFLRIQSEYNQITSRLPVKGCRSRTFRRNEAGLIPVDALKTRVRCIWSEKPQS